jgi:hypothetical protein
VTVVVGLEEERFYIHANLLEALSEYFLKALNIVKEKDQLQIVKLPDADADAFSIYAKWLYTGRFHAEDDGSGLELLGP